MRRLAGEPRTRNFEKKVSGTETSRPSFGLMVRSILSCEGMESLDQNSLTSTHQSARDPHTVPGGLTALAEAALQTL